jgi:hypothetical protein
MKEMGQVPQPLTQRDGSENLRPVQIGEKEGFTIPQKVPTVQVLVEKPGVMEGPYLFCQGLYRNLRFRIEDIDQGSP